MPGCFWQYFQIYTSEIVNGTEGIRVVVLLILREANFSCCGYFVKGYFPGSVFLPVENGGGVSSSR